MSQFFQFDDNWPQFNVLEVLGAMLFPRDAVKRKQFIILIKSMQLIELINNDELLYESKDDLIDLLKQIATELIKTPLFDDIMKGFIKNKVYIGSRIAGEILIYIRQMAYDKRITEHNNPKLREASTLKAKAIIEVKFNSDKCIPLNGGNIFLGKKSHDFWTKYKSVAHLWAAYHELSGDSPEDILTEKNIPISLDNFPLFLSVAENYRKWGETYEKKRGNKTQKYILDKNETWKVPPDYPLGNVIGDIPPLDSWSIEILKGKKLI